MEDRMYIFWLCRLKAAKLQKLLWYFVIPLSQRENRLRASLEKFITLHKARAVYLGGRGRNKNFTQI
jgi:hypothetical protein